MAIKKMYMNININGSNEHYDNVCEDLGWESEGLQFMSWLDQVGKMVC